VGTRKPRQGQWPAGGVWGACGCQVPQDRTGGREVEEGLYPSPRPLLSLHLGTDLGLCFSGCFAGLCAFLRGPAFPLQADSSPLVPVPAGTFLDLSSSTLSSHESIHSGSAALACMCAQPAGYRGVLVVEISQGRALPWKSSVAQAPHGPKDSKAPSGPGVGGAPWQWLSRQGRSGHTFLHPSHTLAPGSRALPQLCLCPGLMDMPALRPC
jgi:hypothetical protein